MSRASAEDVLAAKLFMRAAFPVMRIPLEEDPKMVKKFEKVNTIVEFTADDEENPLACHIIFLTQEKADLLYEGKRFKVVQKAYTEAPEGWENIPVMRFRFKSIKSFLGMLKGNNPTEMLGILPPVMKNLFKPACLSFIGLLLSLTKMMPNFQPEEDEPFQQYLKVKMSLYLITTAMSVATKLGWKPLVDWTARQTDRVYQFHVGPTLDKDGKEIYPEIGAYLRVKYGNTKGGRGVYTRKSPFVLFEFPNPNATLQLLSGKYTFVSTVEHGFVTIIGAGDSYAVTFNDLMTKVQNMLIPSKFVG
jgi:hypothetical protein